MNKIFFAFTVVLTLVACKKEKLPSDLPLVMVCDDYKVSVVCDLPTAIIMGEYSGWYEKMSPSNFPEAGCKVGEEEVSLCKFYGRNLLEFRSVVKKLDQEGYRPATLLELMALRALYPKQLGSLWIVALGSSYWGAGGSGFPHLVEGSEADRSNNTPNIGLTSGDPYSLEWDTSYKFLAVHK
jgi:hypothetical protein